MVGESGVGGTPREERGGVGERGGWEGGEGGREERVGWEGGERGWEEGKTGLAGWRQWVGREESGGWEGIESRKGVVREERAERGLGEGRERGEREQIED